jgi:hypothetical protein
MEETRITFETAKLAKEKKFDLNVSSFFQSNQEIVNEINAAEINSKLYCRSYLPAFKLFHNANSNTEQDWYSRPTQGLLQKWLREVHNIDVEPYLILMESNNRELEQDFDVKEYTYKLKDKGISQFVGNDGVKPSYDESFEIGLQEGLKLIPTE